MRGAGRAATREGMRGEVIRGCRRAESAPMSKLENLQALRGLAALAVVAAHLGAVGPAFPGLPTRMGVFGVDVFFVLSGFIMYYVTGRAWGTPGTFLSHRALRIYPLWWICLLAEAPWILHYLRRPPDEYFGYAATSWFLWPAFTPSGQLYPILGVGWTLIYEVAFYLVFASLMVFERRQLPLKLLVVFGAAYGAGWLLPADSAGAHFLRNPIYFEFIAGVVVGQAYASGALTSRAITWACAAAIVGAVAIALAGVDPRAGFRVVLFGLPAAAILVLALRLELAGKHSPYWLVFLGEASYSLYLTHTIVIHHLKDLLSGWSGLLALLAACLAVGAVVHLVLERPLLWLVHTARARRGEAVAAVP
jgi:exopolysaccharide production protein ExoZ